ENPVESLDFAGRVGIEIRAFLIAKTDSVFRIKSSFPDKPASERGIQWCHAGGKTLRPHSDLSVYSDYRGNTGIPCSIPWAGSTAPCCTYSPEAVTATYSSFVEAERLLLLDSAR